VVFVIPVTPSASAEISTRMKLRSFVSGLLLGSLSYLETCG
jgi:hypothetical protein